MTEGSVPASGLNDRAFRYWESLLDGRDYPLLDQLDPGIFKDFQEQSFLLDLTADPDGNPAHVAVLRHVGAEVQSLGEGDIDGDTPVAMLGEDSIIANLAPHLADVKEHRSPLAFEAELIDVDGEERPYRGVLLPLSDDGHAIHYILGVIDGSGAPLSMAASEHEEEPLAATPASAIADVEPAGVPDTDEGAPPAPEPPPASGHNSALADLYDALVAGRDAAKAAAAAQSRSHKALYEALAAALHLIETAESSPEAADRILHEAGLSIQGRAPMTPYLKLVFGLDYDKTRLAEYASALAYARRSGTSSTAIVDFFEHSKGGLRACVLAERAARRDEDGRNEDNPVEAAKAALRELAPLARLGTDDGDTDGEEFVLLLGRRGAGRDLDVIAPLDEKPRTLDPILKRAARDLARHRLRRTRALSQSSPNPSPAGHEEEDA